MNVSTIALSIALVFLIGCEKERPQPSNADFKEERSKLNERVAERKARRSDNSSHAAQPPTKTGQGDETQYAGEGSGFSYRLEGKRDPFRSFMWERLELPDDSTGPLEQFDVSQLTVMAVVWSTGRARAMVQDPSGRGHIVGVGALIGKNDGTITSIDDNLIVVRETYEDYLGQVTKKDIEMRIRRPDKGGLYVGVH